MPWNAPMRLIVQILLMLACLASFNLRAEARFQPWSEGIFKQIEIEYGKAASQRMRHIHQVIVDNQDAPLHKKLEVTNNTLNALPWMTDKAKYNAEDYWATPLETVALFGGDCEDMAIGKYVMLRMLGIPGKNLYLAYVKVRATGETHMVLVWLNDKRNESLVLDNMTNEVRSGKERTDLLAVFLFDANGKVIVIDDKDGNRTVRTEVSAKKIKKLESIKQSIKANREKYRAYNDGRPLF